MLLEYMGYWFFNKHDLLNKASHPLDLMLVLNMIQRFKYRVMTDKYISVISRVLLGEHGNKNKELVFPPCF